MTTLLKPFRAVVAGSIAALGVLALAGCNNNPYPAGETARPVLYRALGEDVRTLDPTRAYTDVEAQIIDVIYPSYFKYNYLKRPFTLEPNLGARPDVREPYVFREQKTVKLNEDGTLTKEGPVVEKRGEQYTFTLKKGLRFQDDPCFPGGKGREIVAEDILYAFRRTTDPALSCPIQGFLADKIIGLNERIALNNERLKTKQPADVTTPVAGLQVDKNDPYTFHVLLREPYPQLRYLMAMHFTTPIAKEAVDKYGNLNRQAVGCGPFMITEYTPNRRIIEEPNPNRPKETYPTEGAPGDREKGLLADAGRELPLADKIVYTVMREGVTSWNLFLQGYLDSASIGATNYQQALASPNRLSPEMVKQGVTLLYDEKPTITYMCFNMDDKEWGGYSPAKRKLRQAVSLSISGEAYNDLIKQGTASTANFIVPPGLFGYEESYRNPYRQSNVERAKQLLVEAGYPGGKNAKTGERLTLTWNNTATTAAGRQLVGLIQRQIEATGIQVESKSMRSPEWQDALDKGQFQFINYGWLADYPDPENFLFLLYGPNRRPGVNYANYNNPEYNKLFEQMRAMDNGPERLAIIRKMRDIAVEDCPWIYVVHDRDLSLAHGWLTNVKPHGVANDVNKYRGVDAARRARLQAAWNRPNYWPTLGLAALLVVGTLPALGTLRARRERKVRRAGPADTTDTTDTER